MRTDKPPHPHPSETHPEALRNYSHEPQEEQRKFPVTNLHELQKQHEHMFRTREVLCGSSIYSSWHHSNPDKAWSHALSAWVSVKTSPFKAWVWLTSQKHVTFQAWVGCVVGFIRGVKRPTLLLTFHGTAQWPVGSLLSLEATRGVHRCI